MKNKILSPLGIIIMILIGIPTLVFGGHYLFVDMPNNLAPESQTTQENPKPLEKIDNTVIASESLSTKNIQVNEVLPFETEYQTDAFLSKGMTLTKQYGLNGSKSVTYKVTYKGSTEVERTKVSETIIFPAKNKIILNGTHEFTTISPTTPSFLTLPNTSTSHNYIDNYTNNYSSGAICSDGTISYSQNRSGTCSHHGGVSSWY